MTRRFVKIALCLFCVSLSGVSTGQEIRKGKVITCDDIGLPSHRFHLPAPVLKSKIDAVKNGRTNATSTIEVQYSGFSEEAKTAFQFAVDIWESLIISDVPIRINASWAVSSNSNNLGSATSDEARNFEGAPLKDVWYPIPIAEKLARKSLNSENSFDIIANFNAGRDDWYFETDGNTPSGQFDLVTIVLHEIGHGLGFRASMFVFNGNGNWGTGDLNGDPIIFDTKLENSTGQELLDENLFPNNSSELADQLTGNSIVFNSPIAFAETNGLPRIYAPQPYNPGSSISHLDENNYSGTVNSLMTPFAAPSEAMHDPGPLTLFMFADMGWVHTFIDHEALVDQETTIPAIEINITSDSAIVDNTMMLLYSTDNFATTNEIVMTAGGTAGAFTANIPNPSPDTEVKYYFSVKDVTDRIFTNPSAGQSDAYSFFFGDDVIAPSISHEAIGDITIDDTIIPINATVTDNIGVDTVFVRYSINGTDQMPFGLEQQADNMYTGSFDFSGGAIGAGDIIRYAIVAEDASLQNNEGAFPNAGNIAFNVRVFDPQASYNNDFENSEDDFESDGFTIETPQGFTNNAYHSQHNYENATADEVDYILELRFPVIVRAEDANIIFDEVVLVEPGDNDFVVVEGSSDDGATWLPLIEKYDASDKALWLDYYNSDVDEGNSEAVGTLNFFANRTIDMLQTFSAGENIKVRFRLHANNVNNGWGWAIDNLDIQGQVTGINDPKILSDIAVFPNPTTSDLLNFKLPFIQAPNQFSILIQELSGKTVRKISYDKFEPTGSVSVEGLNKGFYLVTFVVGENRFTKRVIKY